MFENYSPHMLRAAIEIELQTNKDAKTAATIALKRLESDPEYYIKNFGVVEMEKARGPVKYIKRIPKPSGKGYIYFYTQQQVKDYYAEKKKPEEKKPFDLFSMIKNIFGFSDNRQASAKIQDDYKANELDKKGVTWDDWKNHLAEYFKNKEKWDAFFNKEKGEKKPSEKKETSEKGEKNEKKKTIIKLSLMKLIHGIYGNIKKPETDTPPIVPLGGTEGVPENNFETMPESESEETLQQKFDKWKSGDLSGIEGSQFNLIQELTDGKVKRTFFDRVIVKKVADGFVSHIDAEGGIQSGSGGISEKSFIRMLNNGSAVPVGLEKETITLDDGAKIETNVDLDDKQKKEESDNEEIASREGYFNEKPAEILNAGDDVWGAARHNFDTYEKVNVNVKIMEENGTAPAYVTKKNLLGKNGLADKDERVKNGESEFKVMASYLIKEYLPKMPSDNEESRSNYMNFIRAIVRLDNDTTKAVDYIAGLSDVYANMFPDAVSKESSSEAQRKKRSGKETVGDVLHVLFTTILQSPDKYALYHLDKRKVKMLNNLTHAISGEKTGSYTYNDVMEDVFGKVKLTGIKMKKGDTFILTDDMKEKFYAMTSEYRAGFSRDDYIKEREALDDKVHQLMYSNPPKQEQYAFIGKEVSGELINSEIRRVAEEKTRKLYDKYLVREKIYPETKGQVIKIGKNEIQVAFPFPDGKIRAFEVKPSDIKPENVASIKKEVEKEKSARINLEVIRKASRKGGKSFDKISPAEAQKMLEKDFKMKAVQYGNSMPDKERIAHTKWTLEALSDLSEILNIPMEQVSVNGKLGIGFGARGKPIPGISGGAAAHYESGTKMINLTRANGIGTLAHEWGHFIDNIMTPSMQGFLTENVNYKSIFVKSLEEIPPGGIIEVKGKRGKVVRYCLDPEKKDSEYPFAKLNEGQSEPSPSSDYVRFKFYKGEVLLPEKESTGYASIAKQISKKSKEWMQAACKEKESSGQDFSHISGSPYYNAPTECFARAFEAYIADKLAESGRDNTYLASTYRTISSDGYLVYPQGEYRKEINKLFDQFFDDLRNSGELKKAIMKLSGKTFIFRKK